MAGQAGSRLKIAGAILALMGLGGMLLSLLWDAIYKGRSFSTGAIGPIKTMGISAGFLILAIGVAMTFLAAIRKRAASAPEAAPRQKKKAVPAAGRPYEQYESDRQVPAAPVYQYTAPPTRIVKKPLRQPQEDIPFALPVEQARPLQYGAEPMEAIPVDDAMGGEQ